MAMVTAGAQRLVDLRGETEAAGTAGSDRPFPDHGPGSRARMKPTRCAARRVVSLAGSGLTIGVYCQAGISRTSTVAIADLIGADWCAAGRRRPDAAESPAAGHAGE